ncbi:MAG: hypothetical protein GX981_06775 [Tissierellia bacterium]|nr:hypothetical protein [Tissierellia bacterium]
MTVYEKGNLIIKSDFEIRILREEGNDIDLFIPLNYRTLNLYLQDLPDYMDNRIQFTEIKNIIIRFSTEKENDYCTIHLLRNIDLHSAVANFIINYKDHLIVLKNREYSSEMHIKKK